MTADESIWTARRLEIFSRLENCAASTPDAADSRSNFRELRKKV